MNTDCGEIPHGGLADTGHQRDVVLAHDDVFAEVAPVALVAVPVQEGPGEALVAVAHGVDCRPSTVPLLYGKCNERLLCIVEVAPDDPQVGIDGGTDRADRRCVPEVDEHQPVVGQLERMVLLRPPLAEFGRCRRLEPWLGERGYLPVPWFGRAFEGLGVLHVDGHVGPIAVRHRFCAVPQQHVGPAAAVVDHRKGGSDDDALAALHRGESGRFGVVGVPEVRDFVDPAQLGKDGFLELETFIETLLSLFVDGDPRYVGERRVAVVHLAVSAPENETCAGDVARARSRIRQ